MKTLMVKILTLAIPALIMVTACSSNRVIVDTKGVDMSHYDGDLQECRAYAEEVPVGGEVARGAARGSIVWGVIGAIFGNSQSAARGAGAGAVAGGAGGAVRSERQKAQVVKTCMRGRGYKVLN